MQNMSISCALVCIIIVVTASLIGLFSVFHHQISAMLITAVMFFLTGNFDNIQWKNSTFVLKHINYPIWIST